MKTEFVSKIDKKFFKQFIPIFLIFSVIVVLTFLIHCLAFLDIKNVGGLDLKSNWQACVEDESFTSGINCISSRINLPDNAQEAYSNLIKDHIEYRNVFSTPSYCVESTSNGCVLFLGGVYQGAEVFLNGYSLGLQFSKSDLFPASFLLPKKYLNDLSNLNEINIKVYVRPSVHHPALTQGPIGVMGLEASRVLYSGILGERVILPVIGCVVSLLMALMAFFWMLSSNSDKISMRHYVFCCFVSCIYMLNLTRYPQEFLSLPVSHSLNFFLRFLMDYSIFLLIISFFKVTNKFIKFFNYWYCFALLLFFILICFSVFNFQIKFFFEDIYIKKNSLSGLRQHTLVYWLVTFFSPLMMINKWLGLKYAFRRLRENFSFQIIFLLFSFLLVMQALDLLTFFGFMNVNHEFYYMRLYTPYISLAFGYAIWMQWIDNEKKSEVILKAGEVARAVAHDLRSPLSVLKIISRSKMKFEEDERQLLVSAIKSIDGIAQNLLDKNRPTSKHRARQSIKKILDHLVQRKNFYLLKNNYSNIKIEFEANPKNNEFLANLNESDFSRAIDNLLMNSIESVLERIKVDRETSEFKIIVQLKLNAPQIEILISDQGSEIDHTTLERLQNKDFTFTTKQSGNGIGLNEVSRILQEHQADLSFSKNISGQGITAKIVVFSAA